MLNGVYPPLEAFLPEGWKPDTVSVDMAAVRAHKGKKKHTRAEPGCYGVNCGLRARDAMAKLHSMTSLP